MIYIDPPYNTGNDFIYRDDYSEPRRAYLEKTGQMDAEGNVLTTNPETSGRYHSDWLSMMYPRLFLARQLLREDGVIFVSIDDHEVQNLRLLMNEIFGEENFLAALIWHRRQVPDNRNINNVSTDHEYVLAYSKGFTVFTGTPKDLSKYTNPDNDPRGPWMSDNMTGLASPEERPNLHYDLVDPETGIHYPPHPSRGWIYEKSRMQQLIEEERILWPSDPSGRPRLKRFLNELGSRYTGFSSILDVGYTTEGTRELASIFGEKVIAFPKPISLMKTLCEQATSTAENDIVMDFFAGSATTAQAILELNREDKGNRRFVMVQLGQPLAECKELDDGVQLETIADIGKERIRCVIARMQERDADGQLPLDLRPDEDLGFKIFKLTGSTFRRWEPPADESAAALEEQLVLFDRGLEAGADPLHVIYEVILKLGYSLNAPIESVAVGGNQGNQVCRVGDAGANPAPFYICLDDDVQDATIDALPLDKETTFVCLDTALDDSQKVNLSMQCLLKVI
jgi:adenine-specific DNA-methyltransferase